MLRYITALAAFLLYGFCGAGAYWLFVGWFHNPDFAGLAGLVVPFGLIWLVWIGWRTKTL